MPSPGRPLRITAFHCTNRARGHSACVPILEYGPNQRAHSLPGSSVLPERTKNSSLGRDDVAADLASLLPNAPGVFGGLHHSKRPHSEKSCASKERDS